MYIYTYLYVSTLRYCGIYTMLWNRIDFYGILRLLLLGCFAGIILIPQPLLDPTLGTSDSCWAIHGAPLGALGHLLVRLGGHGRALVDVRKLPECVQSHFKIIEKPLVFIAFLSIGVIWNLSGGSWAALWGPREVLFGVDVAQREDLEGYFRFLQKTEKGQRLLTFEGWGVNGR